MDKGLERVKQLLTDLGLLDINGNASGVSTTAIQALYDAIVNTGRTPAAAVTDNEAFSILLNQFLNLANRDIRTDDSTNNGAASITLNPASLGKYAYLDIDSNLEISLDTTGSEFGDEFHLECHLTGSGGWTVTWGAGLSATSVAAVAPSFTGDRTLITFLRMHSNGSDNKWTMVAAKEVTI